VETKESATLATSVEIITGLRVGQTPKAQATVTPKATASPAPTKTETPSPSPTDSTLKTALCYDVLYGFNR